MTLAFIGGGGAGGVAIILLVVAIVAYLLIGSVVGGTILLTRKKYWIGLILVVVPVIFFLIAKSFFARPSTTEEVSSYKLGVGNEDGFMRVWKDEELLLAPAESGRNCVFTIDLLDQEFVGVAEALYAGYSDPDPDTIHFSVQCRADAERLGLFVRQALNLPPDSKLETVEMDNFTIWFFDSSSGSVDFRVSAPYLPKKSQEGG